MHQARVRALPLANHPRSYPAHHPTVPVDDTDTWLLAAAARELEAHLLFERTRQVADARALLAELYAGDSVAVEDAMLDAQAEDVARLERADRFLQELAAHLQPDAELLEQAAGADDHTLQVWEEAAASLAEECPPPLASLRWQIEETRRGELRSHAQLVRAETQLAAPLRRFGLAGRLWHRRHLAVLAGQLSDCRRRRQQAERRLALLEAKLAVIEATEQARMVWIAQAREVLVRGVAAARVLADHHPHQDAAVEAPRLAAGDAPGWPKGGVMIRKKAPARRCSWHHCSQPAVGTVAFELPNLLAGSRRDYCADHTSQVCMARGAVLVARFGAQQPVLPGLGGIASAGRPTPRGRRRRKGVMS